MIKKQLFIAMLVFSMSFGLVTMASASNYGFLLDEYGHPTQEYIDSQAIDAETEAAANGSNEQKGEFEVRCTTDYEVASRSTLKTEPCWDLLGS